MSAFNFDAARRWARFDPAKPPSRRADDALPFLTDNPTAGPGLLLDTCVYIDQLQGRTPGAIEHLLALRHVNHSTVAIQELMHTVGVRNPADRRSEPTIAAIGRLINAMPAHRTFTPDADVLGRAALLSGILCRLQNYTADNKRRALQDCVLYLQAQKLSLIVLTANITDFDVLLQLVPTGRALFYRRV